mgnify:CR=1 FL=1
MKQKIVKIMCCILSVAIMIHVGGCGTTDNPEHASQTENVEESEVYEETESIEEVEDVDFVLPLERNTVSLEDKFSAAITENGDLYMWGNNEMYQLGNKESEHEYLPVKVMENVRSCSLGFETAAAVTEDGSLYVWGYNGTGQVGSGDSDFRVTPKKVMEGVVSCKLSQSNSAALTEDGSLYVWGSGDYGQNGTWSDAYYPRKIESLSEVVSFEVAHYMAALTRDGSLYMWGHNRSGQLGIGSNSYEETPQKILSDVISVKTGYEFVGALTDDGSLYLWGNNEHGQIGNGTTKNQLSPFKVMSDVVSFSLGSSHSAAITKDGNLYLWGYNKYGQVGNGTTEDQLVPIQILSDATTCALGGFKSSAFTSDGKLYIWGDSDYVSGIKYDHTPIPNQLTPVEMFTDAAISLIDQGRFGVITKDGTLYLWGDNNYGVIGNGNRKTQPNPVKVLENIRLDSELISSETEIKKGDENVDPMTEKEETIIKENDEQSIFSMKCIVQVTASSSLAENNMVHSPERVIDGSFSTAWVEGTEGQGLGETITVHFDDKYLISGVRINSGYQKSTELFEKNSRPSKLIFTFSDGSNQICELKDISENQVIELKIPVKTESISFTILSVYSGSKYEDTAISEIYIY